MQLTFRDIEKAFEIDEKTLYQWLNAEGLPAVKANGQYFFNSVEVLEWALKKRIRLTPGTMKLCEKNNGNEGLVAAALRRGDVHRHGLQRRFYAAEGVTGEDCGKIETEIARGKGQQQEGGQHGRVA